MSSLIGEIEEFKVKSIQLSRQALRRDLGSLDELMTSIMEKGLLQPIIVRPVDNVFEVVAGNRRLKSCEKLGWRKIPCIVSHLDDKEAFEISLIENVQHKTLEVIEEARAFKDYVDKYGYGGISELSRKIGKSHSYVSRRIAFFNLPDSVQANFIQNGTSFSTLEELYSLREGEICDVYSYVTENNLSSRETRLLLRNNWRKDLRENESFGEFQGGFHYMERYRRINRVLKRSIAKLKITLYRISEEAECTQDDWIIGELLLSMKNDINNQISMLMKFRKLFNSKNHLIDEILI